MNPSLIFNGEGYYVRSFGHYSKRDNEVIANMFNSHFSCQSQRAAYVMQNKMTYTYPKNFCFLWFEDITSITSIMPALYHTAERKNGFRCFTEPCLERTLSYCVQLHIPCRRRRIDLNSQRIDPDAAISEKLLLDIRKRRSQKLE